MHLVILFICLETGLDSNCYSQYQTVISMWFESQIQIKLKPTPASGASSQHFDRPTVVLYIQYRGTILPPRAGRRWRGAPLDLEISSSRRAHRLRDLFFVCRRHDLSLLSSLLSHFRQLKAEEEMNNVVVTKVKRWTPPTRVVSTPRSRRRRKQICGSVFHLTRQRSNVATSSSGPPSEPERPDLATELQYSHGLV